MAQEVAGDFKGIDIYEYRAKQDALEVNICKEYNISLNDFDKLTIEQFYKYLNEYYSFMDTKKQNS